jgi:hypothetical protein
MKVLSTTEKELEERRIYRRNYYAKNKKKIQDYQKEYYQTYLKTQRRKPQKLSWKGEKITGGIIKKEGTFVLDFK